MTLQALDNFALPLDALGVALDVLFGARKLVLNLGAIHLLQLPDLKAGIDHQILKSLRSSSLWQRKGGREVGLRRAGVGRSVDSTASVASS